MENRVEYDLRVRSWENLVAVSQERGRKKTKMERVYSFFLSRMRKMGGVLRSSGSEDQRKQFFVLRSRKIEEPPPIFEETPLRRSHYPSSSFVRSSIQSSRPKIEHERNYYISEPEHRRLKITEELFDHRFHRNGVKRFFALQLRKTKKEVLRR